MKKLCLSLSFLCAISCLLAQDKAGNIFHVVHPDMKKSPYTGMTKKHWKEAALYLLKGAFGYIHTMDDPMQFPKQPGKSYPRSASQVPTEKLEGLCRTLFVASPLLKDNPALEINGIKVADYYRHQLVRLTDSTSPSYIKPRAKNSGPSQILVEFGALSLSLFAAPEVLWEPLSKEQKDALASLMLSYGDGPTVGSNWKFFNIFILSFFKDKGYAVNEQLLIEYVEKSLAHYRGSGWYNDAPAYDYYSMWAFQMYGPLWAEFFGKRYYPAYAQRFLANFNDLKDNYPYMFSRDGRMIMWGRSISYRIAAVVPLALTGLEKDTAVNYGWMRRIASGVMLQFLQHPDFLKDHVPTLGFYGPFEPAVQPYSCRGSVYWMGKAFFALLLPDDSPFWTATENEGPWKTELKKGRVYNKLQDSSHILITNYPAIGASEVRAWCKAKSIGASEPFRSSENYNRLAYNSAFPWQADSSNGTVAMNYVTMNSKGAWEPLRLFDYEKFEDGAYYRNATLETNPRTRFQLVDIPLTNGILRIDRIAGDSAFDTRLGHYALPRKPGAIARYSRIVHGCNIRILDNGAYQLA
ncbi:MAG TPA: DUF2264 domain-containing protein, partial [Chitinophagaceae bacterium]|nr:DUF2264 domain-containing protein [Chitinophagaceae bacterium]